MQATVLLDGSRQCLLWRLGCSKRERERERERRREREREKERERRSCCSARQKPERFKYASVFQLEQTATSLQFALVRFFLFLSRPQCPLLATVNDMGDCSEDSTVRRRENSRETFGFLSFFLFLFLSRFSIVATVGDAAEAAVW